MLVCHICFKRLSRSLSRSFVFNLLRNFFEFKFYIVRVYLNFQALHRVLAEVIVELKYNKMETMGASLHLFQTKLAKKEKRAHTPKDP